MTTTPSPDRRYKRLSPLTPLVRSFIFLVAVVASSWRELLQGNLGPFGWILLGLVAAGAVYGTASWLRTKYWIEDDELRVDTGVISRQSRRIRVDRLQGIDIKQPLAARVFGLAELKMDVAGGGRAEGSLAFLPLKEAQELRELLLARRDAVKRGPAPSPDALWPVQPPKPAPAPDRVLARLDLGMLLVSLVLAGETFGFIISALVFTVIFAIVGSFAGASSVLPVVLGFAFAFGRKFAAFYNFTVSTTASGLQVRRGLLELNTQTIALHRVQGVVVVEHWAWRLLGWARLDVSVAGYGRGTGEVDKPTESVVLPVGTRAQVSELAQHLLSGLDPTAVDLVPAPRRARWAAPFWWRFLAAGVGEEVVASRNGLLTRRTHIAPHARVQSLRLHQGPWQRLLGLADVHVDSPPGPVRVRAKHRAAAEARALLDREDALAEAARHPR
ncbi:MAG: PH domain-containing protein [Nocardioidaceae bacterium]